MTLPTRPHAIFSTLQGTQNPDTKPTLQRAKNANAQLTHPSGHSSNHPYQNNSATLQLYAISSYFTILLQT